MILNDWNIQLELETMRQLWKDKQACLLARPMLSSMGRSPTIEMVQALLLRLQVHRTSGGEKPSRELGGCSRRGTTELS
jgi:hypothetical protein